MTEKQERSLIKSKYLFPLKIGVNHAKNLVEEKRIYLVNAICCCLMASHIFVILIGILFDEKLILPLSIIVYAVQELLVFIVFYLQYIGKFLWSRLLLVFLTTFTCYIFHNIITVTDLIEFYYVIPAIIPLCLFDKKWISVLFLMIQILLFFNVFTAEMDYEKLHFVILFVVPFILFYALIGINNKVELLLEKNQQELQEVNEYKSSFFINLSHEIKTPLTLINGHISRIDFKKPEAENQENLNIVTSQTHSINSIVNDILAISKIDSKNFTLQRAPVTLIPFLYTHHENFKGLFEKKKIVFKLEIDCLDISILCNEKLLSKSVNNLLNNALKFTPEGGEVVMSVTTSNLNIKISIKDNGIGIPRSDMGKIFNQFYQSKNHITKSKGTGIGLSFIKSIIEAHDFLIEVKSLPNEETTFIITIPNKYINVAPKEAIRNSGLEEKEAVKNIIAKNSKRILLVDDHALMRKYLREVLCDFEITEAEHGKEALNILSHHSFDMIISDYMMPVMDGENFVKALKQRNIKAPVLVLTARSDNQGKLNMLRLGVDGYLNKPFLEEELLLRIDKALTSAAVIKMFDANLSIDEKQAINAFANKFNQQLNEFVFANIHSSTFGIDDIAAHFNFSKSTLNRKVKSLLGQTSKEIIMEARLQKARNLLYKNPQETKKKIAQSVGITNTSYFFKKLEERFGKIYN